MDTDERVRSGLDDNAASFTPDVDLALRRVLQRRRATLPWRPLIGIAAAIAALLGLAGLAQRGEPGSSSPSATVPPQTSLAIVNPQFEATIPHTGSDAVADFAGRWRIRFGPQGALTIDPPGSFNGTVTTPAASFSDHELLIDLFNSDQCVGHPPGRYHWSEAPWGDLHLAVLDDSCPARLELLAGPGRIWTRTTSAPTTVEDP